MTIKTIRSREVYRNAWARLREDEIERDGVPGIYAVLEKEPAVIIIPLERTEAGEFVYLVEQFRYTVGARFQEFPQGGWEEADVDPEEMARGELAEETGLCVGKITKLGSLWIAYGAMKQIHHVFLAEELTAGETAPDAEEFDLTLHRVSILEFEEMLLDGRMMDNCSAAAWGMYKVWRERHSHRSIEASKL